MKKFIALFLFGLLALSSPSYAYYTKDGADLDVDGIVFEGATANAYEFTVSVPDPVVDQSGFFTLVTTMANLPVSATANKGQIAVVTDAATEKDCNVGGNTFVSVCKSIGTGNWQPLYAVGTNWSAS